MLVSKAIKYLKINLAKATTNIFNENYNSLKREIEDDIRRQKDLAWLWISRITL
jgi:hypothetical protein